MRVNINIWMQERCSRKWASLSNLSIIFFSVFLFLVIRHWLLLSSWRKQLCSCFQIHLFGTSLGGFLAQLFSQHRPRRVKSLVLSNTFLETSNFSAAMPWAPMYVIDVSLMSFSKQAESNLNLFGYQYHIMYSVLIPNNCSYLPFWPVHQNCNHPFWTQTPHNISLFLPSLSTNIYWKNNWWPTSSTCYS